MQQCWSHLQHLKVTFINLQIVNCSHGSGVIVDFIAKLLSLNKIFQRSFLKNTTVGEVEYLLNAKEF